MLFKSLFFVSELFWKRKHVMEISIRLKNNAERPWVVMPTWLLKWWFSFVYEIQDTLWVCFERYLKREQKYIYVPLNGRTTYQNSPIITVINTVVGQRVLWYLKCERVGMKITWQQLEKIKLINIIVLLFLVKRIFARNNALTLIHSFNSIACLATIKPRKKEKIFPHFLLN